MSLTGLLYVAAFAFACLMCITRHPIYGLMAYVGAFYLDPASRWWGGGILGELRWSLIAATFTLIGIVFHARVKPPRAFLAHPIVILIAMFVLWLAIQLNWVYEPTMQVEFLTIWAKYLLASFIIFRAIETEDHFQWFLMAHILGCVYLGLIAFGSYTTGRFDDFGGAGLKEANAVANQTVTAIVAGASLFLAGSRKVRAVIFVGMPFLLNAMVTTISRSGFIAFTLSGIVYNLLTPKRFQLPVRALSILGIVLFGIVAGPKYWERISSIKARGQEIQGVDTGAARLILLQAQEQMFEEHPWGCGHRCTAYLAPSYLDSKYLDPIELGGTRSSHNSFANLAVEQGLPGIAFYLGMLLWALTVIRRLHRRFKEETSSLATIFPGIAAGLLAVFIGDMFVDYLRHEVRIWLISSMLVMMKLLALRDQNTSNDPSIVVPSTQPQSRR